MPKTSSRDELGDRMKRYEDAYRFVLPRRTYTILRVDGRSFHTWTRGLQRPYDLGFMDCMDYTALILCASIAGARFAYVQSDEISVLATDFDQTTTQPWFDGVLQKWASVGAACAASAFNHALMVMQISAGDMAGEQTKILGKVPNAEFDARVFTI